jgi:Glycine transporter
LTPESRIMEKLPIVLDLTGTFVFALSGALAGVKRELDLFGVLVLSFAAGNSGGIARDLLIGVVPPGAVGDWRYLGVSLFAGLITFYFSPLIVRMSNSVLFFDAAGLALFAVAGASKALAHGPGSKTKCWLSDKPRSSSAYRWRSIPEPQKDASRHCAPAHAVSSTVTSSTTRASRWRRKRERFSFQPCK